jgi:prepilin-type N-terminal cleavage/methylation domain-containing protein
MRPATGTSRLHGFSLVEVLVSLFILTVGLVGMAEAVGVAFRSSKESELETAAVLLASSRIEELRAVGLIIEGEEEGDFGETLPLYSWRRSVVETTTAGLHEVTVTIHLKSTDEQLREVKTLLFDVPLTTTLESSTTDPRSRRGRRNPW